MEHCVGLTDFARARKVGERALVTVDRRREGERLNVWAALLQLEQRYGSEEELQRLLARALKQNDDLSLRLRYVDVLVAAGPAAYADAERVLKEAAR